jgi:hypothetical protein
VSSASLTEPLSARTFLLGDTASADTAEVLAQSLDEQGVLHSAIRGLGGLSASAVQAVNHQIATIADGLLNLDFDELLMSGWRKYADLTKAAKRTLANPGCEEIVVLATHRIVSTHHPSVDLIIDEAKAHTFVFELTVMFDLTGVAAVIRGGDLAALRGGECMVTAKLTLQGTPLELTRKGSIDLGLVLPLRRPIPLAQQGPYPPITRLDHAATLDEPWLGVARPGAGPMRSHPSGRAP